MGQLDHLIPVISIVLGIGIAAVAIVTRHRRDVQELEMRHKERMAAIEKGLDLPPEVAARGSALGASRPGAPRYLLRGLVWLGIGIAVATSGVGEMGGNHSYGWIAVAIGAAYLIYYLVEGRAAKPPSMDGGQPRDGVNKLP